mmetsp:Transcript_57705/g.134453  ORF Transcript_57705/g.134453 Transcript_57705/m.134453 type:complete len:213 (+) Transcript_57705:899-1537(+)
MAAARRLSLAPSPCSGALGVPVTTRPPGRCLLRRWWAAPSCSSVALRTTGAGTHCGWWSALTWPAAFGSELHPWPWHAQTRTQRSWPGSCMFWVALTARTYCKTPWNVSTPRWGGGQSCRQCVLPAEALALAWLGAPSTSAEAALIRVSSAEMSSASTQSLASGAHSLQWPRLAISPSSQFLMAASMSLVARAGRSSCGPRSAWTRAHRNGR